MWLWSVTWERNRKWLSFSTEHFNCWTGEEMPHMGTESEAERLSQWSRGGIKVTATLRKSWRSQWRRPWMAYKHVREKAHSRVVGSENLWDGVGAPAREYVLRWLERQDLTIGLASPLFFVPQPLWTPTRASVCLTVYQQTYLRPQDVNPTIQLIFKYILRSQ